MNEIVKAKVRFFQRFGEQKLDIVNLSFADQSPFKRLVLAEAIKIS